VVTQTARRLDVISLACRFTAIVVINEIGGTAESVGVYIKANVPQPVVAYIAGVVRLLVLRLFVVWPTWPLA